VERETARCLCATGEGEAALVHVSFAVSACTHFGTFSKSLVGTSTQLTDKSTACIHSMASASETQPVQQAVDIR
jgi:hypothetical protein